MDERKPQITKEIFYLYFKKGNEEQMIDVNKSKIKYFQRANLISHDKEIIYTAKSQS